VAGNGNWVLSEQLARRSLKANRTHASTWRTLVYALSMQGRMADARDAAGELRLVEPGLTVARFRDRFPGSAGPMADPWAEALREAGIPD
jgi:hypothetical protein